MRESRLRIGMEVVQKVSGKKFRVTEVESKETGKVAEAVEILQFGACVTDEPEKVTISNANDICFRIVYDPGPTESVTGYDLKDGVIYFNENPVEQGEIVVDSILAALPGGLVVTVKTKDESTVDMYFYDVERDLFTLKFAGMPKEDIVVFKTTDTDAYLGFNCIHTKKVKEENGTEKEVREFAHGVVFRISYGKQCAAHVNMYPLLLDEAEFTDTFVYIPYEECMGKDGFLEKCNRGYYIFDVEHSLQNIFRVESNDTPTCTYVPYSGNLLVRADNKLYVNGDETLRTR